MKCKGNKLKFGNNGDMFQHSTNYEVDFKLSSADRVRGEYFEASERSSIYLDVHESIYELINTNVHEDLHRAIAVCDSDYELDLEQEHLIIRIIMQTLEDMYYFD